MSDQPTQGAQQLQSQLDSFVQSIHTDLSQAREKVYEGLVLSSPVPVCQEQHFVNFFLPCFAGAVNPTNWMLNWIEIAGSAMSPVNVVDQAGRVLFTVPPLLASTVIRYDRKGYSLKTVMERHETLKNTLSGGTRYLYEELSNQEQSLTAGSKEEAEAAWSHIYQRYGYTVSVNLPIQSQDSSNNRDIFEY